MDTALVQREDIADGGFLVALDSTSLPGDAGHSLDVVFRGFRAGIVGREEFGDLTREPGGGAQYGGEQHERPRKEAANGLRMRNTQRFGDDLAKEQDKHSEDRGKGGHVFRTEGRGRQSTGQRSACRVGNGVQREDGRDGALNIGAKLVQYLTGLGAGVAHLFKRGPRDGIEHGFQRGAECGNGKGQKCGDDKGGHGRAHAGFG